MSAPPQCRRVLLVEDDPVDAEITRQNLLAERPARFEIVQAQRLATALQECALSTFDVILLDLSLPDATGIDALARLRSQALDTPLIVLTGREEEGLGPQLLQMGAQDYLVKGQLPGRAFVRSLGNAMERHAIQLELQKAREEALKAARAKSDFLASMSHEIRTPLNSILGMAELLSESGLSREQERYVSVFRSAGETLLDLINGILDLSKLESGRLAIAAVAFDIEPFVVSTLELLAFSAHQKGLTLGFELARDVEPRFLGDQTRLRQVLINLVGNAVKFTDQGDVFVSVAWAEASEPRQFLCFSVADTGIGIPADKLETIFERFEQADGSITRRFGGTGLGLSLSKGLVELMGGRITVESEPGRGSLFQFTLPLKPVISEPRPSEGALGGTEALVAVASEAERRILRNSLFQAGVEVSEAASSDEAIASLRSGGRKGRLPDFLVLDCRMRPSGGLSVLDAVADLDGVERRTVMLLTADHRPGDIQMIEARGLGGWLTKPWSPTQLTDLLVAVHEGGGTTRAPAGAQDESRPATVPRTILAVDDSVENRNLIQAFLKKTPHRLVTAENGQQALEALREATFDLVLMDMQMPVMDGYSAVKEIRCRDQILGIHTAVVALTAFALEEEKERSLLAGCDAHLTKPIRKADLRRGIDEYSRLSTFAVDVDPDLADLVDGFLENRRAEIATLRSALDAQDFRAIHSIGHKMKGNGRAYGFSGISEIGESLERAADAADGAAVELQRVILEDYLARVRIARAQIS